MPQSGEHVVTGAFGYSGRRIAARLLAAGFSVRTLTNSPDRQNEFAGRVPATPLCFDDPARLAESLRGAEVLYNTYWVRFNHPARPSATRPDDFTHAAAVRNTLALFQAARAAGVQRIVHVSIANPSEDSPLEYYRGKARLERALRESGLSHAILRPTVLFGERDILVNNIAWALRHLPVFGVFGDGAYPIRPIHVDDLAALAVYEGSRREDVTIDAVGPESFRYRELVQTLAQILRLRRAIVSVPPWLGFQVGRLVGWMVNDVVITREEIAGLMAGLLGSDAPAAGHVRLTEWAVENAGQLGRRYASELARRIDRRTAYSSL